MVFKIVKKIKWLGFQENGSKQLKREEEEAEEEVFTESFFYFIPVLAIIDKTTKVCGEIVTFSIFLVNLSSGFWFPWLTCLAIL